MYSFLSVKISLYGVAAFLINLACQFFKLYLINTFQLQTYLITVVVAKA